MDEAAAEHDSTFPMIGDHGCRIRCEFGNFSVERELRIISVGRRVSGREWLGLGQLQAPDGAQQRIGHAVLDATAEGPAERMAPLIAGKPASRRRPGWCLIEDVAEPADLMRDSATDR